MDYAHRWLFLGDYANDPGQGRTQMSIATVSTYSSRTIGSMSPSPNEVKYLLFDVESVADGDSIARTRYSTRALSAQQAIALFRQELLIESGRDFIPYTYHTPVALVAAKIRDDFSLIEIVSLDEPQFRPEVITRFFWMGWERYARPTLVTFNGRSFDIPLMELSAFRYGVSVPAWFNIYDKSFEQNRNRYNLQSHLDLHEILTNFGSSWFRGGLNLAACLLNKPGKLDVQGNMVQDLHAQGKLAEISEYCRCDVLDTYFVFLRVQVLMGRLTLEQELELVGSTKRMLESQSDSHPAYRAYLDQWGDWRNPFSTQPNGNPTRTGAKDAHHSSVEANAVGTRS
jgi:predicted PolB exonuclease-like 3'-5' exonuclease